MTIRRGYDQDMGHPEHQKYWFMLAGAFGALVIAMIASAATVAGTASRFNWAGQLMIIGYVAAAGVVASFLCGIRQCRFPLATVGTRVKDPVGGKDQEKVPLRRRRYLPRGSTWDDVDKDLKKYKESHERQPGQ